MLSLSSRLKKVVVPMMSVMLLTACTTLQRAPVNSEQLGEVIKPLPGAKGATRVDQRKIDQVVAMGCAGKIISKQQCDSHTKASAERKREF